MSTDRYYFSVKNPVANADQLALEDKALRLIARPELVEARATAEVLFRQVMKSSSAFEPRAFEAMMDEYVFHYALRAAGCDGQHPGALRFMAPPHRWFGRDVPGSRWGFDSPDFVYRTIPIAYDGQYEIVARPSCAAPPVLYFALMSNNTAAPTIQALRESTELQTEADGAFAITVDADPAGGRPNHIQARPDSAYVWIRDALTDWDAQTPDALTVTRLNPPSRAPVSDEEAAAIAARALLDGIYYSYYLGMVSSSGPANEARQPGSSGALGGMASQYTSGAHIALADDDAFIVTTNSAGASFRNAVLSSIYNMSLNYWDRTSSLNSAQMAPDADGRFTFVIAHHDPGVHNWLDTSGLSQVKFGHRWQSFSGGTDGDPPTISGRTVKFAALERELPAGVQRTDAAGRAAQLAARRAGFNKRFADK